MKSEILCDIIKDDCEKTLKTNFSEKIHLTFLDPPFNQGKEYNSHNDNMSEDDYWDWLTRVCKLIFEKTVDGGAIYFMQREKNARFVLDALSKSGWTFQNLIIWRKKSAAVPGRTRYAKHYQIIAYATKGDKPRVFNKLRIDPPYARSHNELGYRRKHGMALTDVWDDIRELTSGYFSGHEPLRDNIEITFPDCKKCNKQNVKIRYKKRAHKQQSPVALLTRIILSSTKIGDLVFDPFAGTGTTVIVAKQLQRKSVSVELDSKNVDRINARIESDRQTDSIINLRHDYDFTTKQDGSNVDLHEIWKLPENIKVKNKD
jgi:DNA modification methylase